jgi:di/tricarboxylate transporter
MILFTMPKNYIFTIFSPTIFYIFMQFSGTKNYKKSDLGIRLSLENFSTYPPINVFPLYAISTLRQD